jgi:hypothetical protein
MSDHQARFSRDDVYDHEHDEGRPGGRRRRPVADWGVGDDVFEHMPRNRFSRAAEGPPRDRRFRRATEDGERFEPREEAEDRRARHDDRDDFDAPGFDRAEGDLPRRRRAEAPDPHEAEVPRGGVEGRRTIPIGKPEDVPSEIAAVTADRDLGDIEEPIGPERRTVKIGGRPEGSLEAARFQRDRARRPPKTAHERIGARPDRLAMWAVALGILLIVIAILSQ